jgi:putative endonuclease
MPFFVYVLTNPSNRTYVGQTDSVPMRLLRHNAGLVHSTAPYRPWRVLFAEEFATRGEAMKREKALKGGQGREYIKGLVASSIGPPEAASSPRRGAKHI